MIERLLDIQEAITHIERYLTGGREAFERDELIQAWMVRHLQIIGEAARALSEPFRNQHSNIPWSRIIGMRHILVHNYFEINTAVVWSVVERDLPDFKTNIDGILQGLPPRA